MLYNVTDAANLSVVLTDGPYGGGVCGATNHSHHVSLIALPMQRRKKCLVIRRVVLLCLSMDLPVAWDGGQRLPAVQTAGQFLSQAILGRQVHPPARCILFRWWAALTVRLR